MLERVRRSRGRETTETVCAVTSLGPEKASAERLLEIARGHWSIENRLHWVRDMSLGEDACRVRSGEAPEVLAAVRNAGLWLLRSCGVTNIASALRHYAAKAQKAVEMVMSYAPS